MKKEINNNELHKLISNISVTVSDLTISVKQGFDSNDARFDRIEAKLTEHDFRFDKVEAEIEELKLQVSRSALFIDVKALFKKFDEQESNMQKLLIRAQKLEKAKKQ